MKQIQIATFLQAHPELRHRQYIPLIVEMMTGVTRKQQIEAKTTLRRLQEEIPNDAKGKKLEEAWRYERGQASIFELAKQ